MLAEYEAPPIDDAVDEELREFDRAQEGVLPGLERLMAPERARPDRRRVAELLRRSRYEVIPLAGAEEQVLEHVPRDVTLTVTASPVKGLDDTLELAAKLAAHGYPVVPHLSARLVVDRAHLGELVVRIGELGVRDVFVVAGDADQPAGAFSGAAGCSTRWPSSATRSSRSGSRATRRATRSSTTRRRSLRCSRRRATRPTSRARSASTRA